MSEHVVPRKVYFAVFAALLVLTAITTAVAFVDLGPWNTVVALGIAFLKATLVALFFMHVRYSTRLTQITVAGGLFWLAILIVLTLSDFLSRGWLPVLG
ncbi:MAG: cytochrome C oxidase subunit IV family protein [Acidobacteriota bacterium]|nr:cytochrome C oxidase subunit IV family protein [Acidobacteriota bacterium]